MLYRFRCFTPLSSTGELRLFTDMSRIEKSQMSTQGSVQVHETQIYGKYFIIIIIVVKWWVYDGIIIYIYMYIYIYLVGGAMCPSWKMMEFVNGKDDIPYMKWKIKFMFETTYQKIYGKIRIVHHLKSVTWVRVFLILHGKFLCFLRSLLLTRHFVSELHRECYAWLHQPENCWCQLHRTQERIVGIVATSSVLGWWNHENKTRSLKLKRLGR